MKDNLLIFGVIFLAFALIWIIAGIFTYGLVLAYLQREYTARAADSVDTDKAMALTMACFGLIGLWTVLTTTGSKHGLMFRVKPQTSN